jgi:hypothetical protein
MITIARVLPVSLASWMYVVLRTDEGLLKFPVYRLPSPDLWWPLYSRRKMGAQGL